MEQKNREYVKWIGDIEKLLNDGKIKNIIFDTDAGPDGDDTAALVMLYHYANLGKIKLLTTVSDTSSPYGASYLSALNRYYGYPNVSVGTMKTDLDILPNCRGNIFNIKLTAQYDTDVYDGPCARDAVDVYRETLAAAEDNSIIIVATGMKTNLADLLRSKPDKYSELDGEALVAKKVKFVSDMGGEWPVGKEFNIENDIKSAREVAACWPTPIIYSGYSVGVGIRTGPEFEAIEADSPLRTAWWYMSSWDETSAIVAVEGLKDYWILRRGDTYIDENGKNYFTENGETGARFYLVHDDAQNEIIATYISNIVNSVKKNSSDRYKIKSILAENVSLDGKWRKITEHQDTRASHTLGKALICSNDSAANMTVSFIGKELHIYGAKGMANGKFAIYADGVYYGECNTALDCEPTYVSQYLGSVVFDDNKEHTVKICMLGNKTVGIDFFKILGDI